MANKATAFREDDTHVLHFTLERHVRLELKGRVSINDVIDVSYDEGDETYMVYNADGSPEWTSVHKDRNTAILMYLQKRLGIIAEKSEETAMPDNDLAQFLTDFQGKVKASRGKSPENDAILDIAEIWIERELTLQKVLTRMSQLLARGMALPASYCSGAMKTMTLPGYAQKSEESLDRQSNHLDPAS